ncbi:MAG: DUF423 domain-containing protein [Rhodocyclaceae bacterium]|jgi:uncharacterized membrane protein YgdD (TMEM256/DUF423 family)|nr:DUF423 domain-containing protein [Rhodocyclaceae bacterium]
MNATAKTFLVVSALLALSSIILGTIAAHAPSEQLLAAKHWFDTAMQYQQFHALALFGVGLMMAHWPSRAFAAAGWLMILATLLFSGTLYQRSMLGYHDLHWLTPYGGWAYLAGWIALIVGVIKARRA